LAAVATTPAVGQEKKDDKKESPAILTCSALAVLPGATKVLKFRGQMLADASAVAVTTADKAAVPAAIKGKGKSEPPKPFDAKRAGDAELQVELKLPADVKPGAELSVVATTPAGATPPFAIRVADPTTTVEEKEPNGGFKAAQELPTGKAMLGAIENPMDVDVYRIGGRARQTVVVELTARGKGSLLDAALTVYDAAGRVLATADDAGPDARDPVLRFTPPSDGAYHVAVIDANDRGSAAHCYELSVRDAEK
jgi:hypothetical protein